jgi:hypothetical protein
MTDDELVCPDCGCSGLAVCCAACSYNDETTGRCDCCQRGGCTARIVSSGKNAPCPYRRADAVAVSVKKTMPTPRTGRVLKFG